MLAVFWGCVTVEKVNLQYLGAVFVILIGMVSIQAGASLAKGLFPVLGPPGTTLLRQGFSALVLLGLWRPWRYPLSSAQLKPLLAYGAALGVMNLTFYLALARIPLGIAVALEFVGPLTVAFLSSRRALDFVWALLAAAGIWLVFPGTSASGSLDSLDPVGVAFALIAGVCWGLYIWFGKRTSAVLPAGIATTLGMVIAAGVAAPFGIAHAGGALLNFSVLPLAFLVAMMTGAIPYSLEMVALKRLPAHTFGILMSLEPAVAGMAGLALLGEQLSVRQWTAIGFVMLASLGTAIANAPRPSMAAGNR
ncbi:MAG: EamA family transporter [Bacteriovoracia bacterium]